MSTKEWKKIQIKREKRALSLFWEPSAVVITTTTQRSFHPQRVDATTIKAALYAHFNFNSARFARSTIVDRSMKKNHVVFLLIKNKTKK